VRSVDVKISQLLRIICVVLGTPPHVGFTVLMAVLSYIISDAIFGFVIAAIISLGIAVIGAIDLVVAVYLEGFGRKIIGWWPRTKSNVPPETHLFFLLGAYAVVGYGVYRMVTYG
jgi:hypothetical protein